MLKRALGATVSVCAFAMVMQSAAAQDVSGEAEPEMESRTLSTVTVTATRREENIQSTGASVSALDSEALLDRSVQSVEDVADMVPGLHVSNYQGDTSIFIRGIGTPVIAAGAGSSTAT